MKIRNEQMKKEMIAIKAELKAKVNRNDLELNYCSYEIIYLLNCM